MARALVTGSTSGLGLEFAWQLAGTGHDLVLVARSAERLEAIAAYIRDAHRGVEVEVLDANLADRTDLERVARRLTDPVSRIDLLVNTPWRGLQGGFLEVDIAEHEHQLDTQVRPVMVLCHAASRSMVQRRRGGIINVSSLAGFGATGAESALKSWITVFTEALAAELAGTGVTATALLPGFVSTEAHERAAMNVDGLPRVGWMKAPFVVQRALQDAAKGRVISIPTIKHHGEREAPRSRTGRLLETLGGAGILQRLHERKLQRASRSASRSRLRAPWQRDSGDAPENAEREPVAEAAAGADGPELTGAAAAGAQDRTADRMENCLEDNAPQD